jgi:hypothetical protein
VLGRIHDFELRPQLVQAKELMLKQNKNNTDLKTVGYEKSFGVYMRKKPVLHSETRRTRHISLCLLSFSCCTEFVEASNNC